MTHETEIHNEGCCCVECCLARDGCCIPIEDRLEHVVIRTGEGDAHVFPGKLVDRKSVV